LSITLSPTNVDHLVETVWWEVVAEQWADGGANVAWPPGRTVARFIPWIQGVSYAYASSSRRRLRGIAMRCSFWSLAVVAASFVATPVRGAVQGSNAGGFTVREDVESAGPPASAWKRLIDVGSWWDPHHTYSGRSSNLTLTLRPGGCWCEKLEKGGFVRHLEVVLMIPEKTLRLTGGLGPLRGSAQRAR